MPRKFEKNIEQQLSNFSLEPSPQIWQEVEKALHPQQKRRGIFWWWIPFLFLLLAGGGWWLFNSDNKTNNNIQPAIIQNKKLDTVDSIINQNSISENIPSVVKQENNKINKEKLTKQKATVNTDITPSVKEKNEMSLTEMTSKNIKLTEVAEKEKVTAISLIAEKNNSEIKSSKEKDSDSLKTEVQKNIDSVITKKITSNNTFDSTAKSALSIKSSQKNNVKKSNQLLVTFGVGMLNTSQTGFLSAAQNNQAYTAANSNTVNTGSLNSPRNGFNLMVGIGYEYDLSKRWKLNTGFQYRYLQNKQSVGTDSVSTSGIIYYTTGNLTMLTNYSHWFELPLGISYSLNPSAKNKFQLLLGGSLAWSFTEKWVVTDLNNYTHPYYYNESLSNYAIINAYAGIGYNNNDRFRISLLTEQSITPIHKQVTEKYYWQQLLLQISKPIHLSSKNHKPYKP